MKILYFDICAIIVLLVMLYAVIVRRLTIGRANKYFVLLLVINIVSGVFDFFSESYGIWIPVEKSVTPLMLFFSYGYFSMRNLTSLVYVLYLIALTDTWHKLKKRPLLGSMIYLPYIIIIVTLISNQYTHKVFWYDENFMYERGSYLFILYICSAVYMIIGITHLLVCRKLFSKDRLAALLVLFPLEIIAIIIQLLIPQALVEIFFTMIAFLLIMLSIQRPEERIDPIIKAGNYYAYTNDVKRSLINQKQMDIIIIKFTNYLSAFSLLGYDEYNRQLKKIFAVLTSVVKKSDMQGDIYYIDRGRFALIFDRQDKEDIKCLAAQLDDKLKNDVGIGVLELTFSSCICMLRCPEDIGDFKTLISFGEKFHMIAKDVDGVIDAEELASQNYFHLNNEIESILTDAIINNKFEVYYQPIYSAKRKKIVSAEALIRLYDEKYGFISPELFITEAEKNGVIHQIGDFVLESVCRFIAGEEFKELGLEYIEVNLSVAQCMRPDLAEHICDILDKYYVSYDKINLEITETAMDYSQQIMLDNLFRLSKAGVSFSLDDYGTGYSNVKRLIELPLRIVKLDKSFVDDVDNPRMWIVLIDTIRMLKDMNMEIVVEGIETEDLVEKFAALQCDYIQGYYFSKPIPKLSFVKFCKGYIGK